MGPNTVSSRNIGVMLIRGKVANIFLRMEIFCDICGTMIQWMGIVNLTPDSFFEPSRAWGRLETALARIRQLVADGASIIDLGAVSTRPGAADVSLEEEWRRLEPVLKAISEGEVLTGGSEEPVLTGDSVGTLLSGPSVQPVRGAAVQISIDTTRSEIVRRAFELIGPFIVNDISAGEDDPRMLSVVSGLGLPFVAMHKRGSPQTMDTRCDYPDGVMPELLRYFADFEARAAAEGVSGWILDPGLGFAKTNEQNWEILRELPQLKVFGRPILIGAADKRFTRCAPDDVLSEVTGEVDKLSGTEIANFLAVKGGASILRVHQIPK